MKTTTLTLTSRVALQTCYQQRLRLMTLIYISQKSKRWPRDVFCYNMHYQFPTIFFFFFICLLLSHTPFTNFNPPPLFPLNATCNSLPRNIEIWYLWFTLLEQEIENKERGGEWQDIHVETPRIIMFISLLISLLISIWSLK